VSSGAAESAGSACAAGKAPGAAQTRVVVVAEFVDPTKNSTGYYWHKTIRGLAETGTEVVVVSTAASIALAQPLAGPVRWCPIPKEVRYNNDVVPLRILGQFRLALALARTARSQLRASDVLFCGTNPPFLLVMLGLLRRWGQFRLVMLVHDVFPENAVAAGLISDQAPHFKLLKWIYDRTYERADALIAIGRDMVETLRLKTRGRTAISYVPNWVDASEISTCDKHHAPLAASAPGEVLFQYFGNLGRVQGLDLLLSAIAQVRHPAARFVFIGSGALAEQVKAIAAADLEGRVRVLPPVSLQRSNEGLLSCDVAMITLAPGMRGLAVPSKAYFSMAADKPILVVGDREAELDLLLREHSGIGWFCRAGDPVALARLIECICDDDLASRKGFPRRLVESNFDIEKAIRAYLPILLDAQD